MKRDPTLAEMMAEWDEIARAAPFIDPSAPTRELARMEQRRIDRKIALARKITESVDGTAPAATKDTA